MGGRSTTSLTGSPVTATTPPISYRKSSSACAKAWRPTSRAASRAGCGGSPGMPSSTTCDVATGAPLPPFPTRSIVGSSPAARTQHRVFRISIGDDVQKALLELPYEFREAVVLCDIVGLSYEEIARAVRGPRGHGAEQDPPWPQTPQGVVDMSHAGELISAYLDGELARSEIDPAPRPISPPAGSALPSCRRCRWSALPVRSLPLMELPQGLVRSRRRSRAPLAGTEISGSALPRLPSPWSSPLPRSSPRRPHRSPLEELNSRYRGTRFARSCIRAGQAGRTRPGGPPRLRRGHRRCRRLDRASPASAAFATDLDELLDESQEASYTAEQAITCSTPDGAGNTVIELSQASGELHVGAPVAPDVEVASGFGGWTLVREGAVVSSANVPRAPARSRSLATPSTRARPRSTWAAPRRCTPHDQGDGVVRAELVFDVEAGALLRVVTFQRRRECLSASVALSPSTRERRRISMPKPLRASRLPEGGAQSNLPETLGDFEQPRRLRGRAKDSSSATTPTVSSRLRSS